MGQEEKEKEGEREEGRGGEGGGKGGGEERREEQREERQGRRERVRVVGNHVSKDPKEPWATCYKYTFAGSQPLE